MLLLLPNCFFLLLQHTLPNANKHFSFSLINRQQQLETSTINNHHDHKVYRVYIIEKLLRLLLFYRWIATHMFWFCLLSFGHLASWTAPFACCATMTPSIALQLKAATTVCAGDRQSHSGAWAIRQSVLRDHWSPSDRNMILLIIYIATHQTYIRSREGFPHD